MYNNINFNIGQGIATIQISREQAKNAINPEALIDLEEAIGEVATDDSVKVVIIKGDDDFCAGADIKRLATLSEQEVIDFSRHGQSLLFKFEQLEVPIIACVTGYCLGGGLEITLACDIVYAAENAIFGMPEVNHGFIPGFGATIRLSTKVGKAKAKELCMTGTTITAIEAKEIGLVNGVFPYVNLMTETQRIANNLTEKSKTALAAIKACTNATGFMSIDGSSINQTTAFASCVTSEEGQAGIKKFIKKHI